ncbi:MAG TPA: maleylpyruvate isomerase family mycothiol-dependent enzyme [Acidimicrobiales bacterium]|nr:maleylpyruvate isomerase family mycothiol-dependent enzyme [Acidimicrobiales bacterium]
MSGIDTEYAKTKAALIGAIGKFDSPAWSTKVPATPDWTVRDVVAHVTGNAVDGANGTMPANLNLLEQFRDAEVVKARDEFAEGQVYRREGRTPAELVREWDAAEPALVERLRLDANADGALPFGFDVVLLTDLCVHSDDVANALGRLPNRDTRASRIAFSGYCFGVDYRIRALGLPALGLRYGAKEKTLGEGPPAATVSADIWELLRAFAGRRSRAQIAALDWEGDPEPFLELIPAYGEREDDLVEG